MAKYFIIINNAQAGPFSIYELKDMEITPNTPVWTEGMGDWEEAINVNELRTLLFNTSVTPPPYKAAAQIPAQEYKKKSGSMLKWVALIFVLCVAILAVLCPGYTDHKQALRKQLVNLLLQDAPENSSQVVAVNKLLDTSLANTVFDNLLDYHCYLIFSTCSIHFGSREHTVSYGFANKILTVNVDNLSHFIDKFSEETTTPTFIDKWVDKNENTEINDPQSNITNDTTATKQKHSKLWNALRNEALKSIGQLLKEEIGEQTDSTSSKHINEVIDIVTKWAEEQ